MIGDEGFEGLFIDCDCHYWIILPPDASAGLVAHECFHAVFRILKDHDIDISEATEEAGAYLTQYVVGEVARYLLVAQRGKNV